MYRSVCHLMVSVGLCLVMQAGVTRVLAQGAAPDPLEQAARSLAGDPDTALAEARAVRDQATAEADLLTASRAEEVMAQAHVARRDFARAGMAYDRAIDLAEEARAPARALAILSNLSKLHFRIGEYVGAMDVENRSLEIARRAELPLQEAQSLNNMGVLYRRQGDAEKALEFYLQSLNIRQRIGDQRGIAQSLNNIGILHKNWGNYFQGLEYHLRALDYRRQAGDTQEIVQSLSNIGIIYRNLSDYGKALEYFAEARELLSTEPDPEALATSELNLGHTFLLQERYTEAEKHLLTALEMTRQQSLRPKITETLERLGQLSLRQGDTDMALARLRQALRLAEEIGEPAQVATAQTALVETLLAREEYDAALEMSADALATANGLEDSAIVRDAYDVRARALAAVGRFEEALAMREAHEQRAISLLSAVNSRRMADLEASLELQRNQSELDALQLENRLQNEVVQRQRLIGIGLIGLVVFTLALLALLVSRFRLARKVNETLSKQTAKSQRQHDELSLAHTELERRAEELAIAATTDPLTGLHNRYYVIRELERMMDACRMHGGRLSIGILDYDRFKQLNDGFSHLGGDKVLRDGARLMRETFGSDAVLGRFGGEEFLVLMEGLDLEQARQRCEDFRYAVEHHRFRLRGRAIPVTISIGVAEFGDSPQLDLDGFLHVADEALYDAKREGRNRVVAALPPAEQAPSSVRNADE